MYAQAIVQAYHQGQSAELDRLAQDADPTLGRCAELLALSLQTSKTDSDREDSQLDALLSDSEQLPADLAICVYYIAFKKARLSTSVQPIIDRMVVLQAHCTELRSRFLVYRAQVLSCENQDRFAAGLQVVRQALQDAHLRDDQHLWLEWRYRYLILSIYELHFAEVPSILTELEPFRGVLINDIGVDLDHCQTVYFMLSGQSHRILTRYDSLTPEQKSQLGEQSVRLSALIITGQFEYAQRCLDQLSFAIGPADQTGSSSTSLAVSPAILSSHRFDLAYETGQYDLAEQALRDAASYLNFGESWRPVIGHRQLTLALANGQINHARRLLRDLDPHGDRSSFDIFWLRLHIATGDRHHAAIIFHRMRQNYDDICLANLLRQSRELTAQQLGTLWMDSVCLDQVPQRSSLDTTPSPTLAQTLLVGHSHAMNAARTAIAKMAPHRQTILISGETGTGKEIVAQLLHQSGPHPEAPFVALNCSAIPATLAEAELFGYTAGSFTGANKQSPGLIGHAGVGTVFLDEISSMPLALQGLLLRVLETGDYRPLGSLKDLKVQARFVIASNESLSEAVAEGRFRSDLYYRLSRFTIDLPPLRQRREDIPELCRHFIDQLIDDPSVVPSSQLLQFFHRHDWPGNVRELRNHIERLVLLYPRSKEIPAETSSQASAQGHIAQAPASPMSEPASPNRPSEQSGHNPEPIPPQAENGTPAANIPIACIPGTSKARHRRRQALAYFDAFQDHIHVADIAEHCRCTPATAARDLQVLTELGLIRRVITSANLRTSYFVKVDE